MSQILGSAILIVGLIVVLLSLLTGGPSTTDAIFAAACLSIGIYSLLKEKDDEPID